MQSLLKDKKNVKTFEETVSPWVTGGKIGTKSCVLVFRTSALCKLKDDNKHSLPSTSSECATVQNNDEIVNCLNSPNVLETQNPNTPKSNSKKKCEFYEECTTKRVRDSLSSSDTSISSACDDPAEIEADIVKESEKLKQECENNSINIVTPSVNNSEESIDEKENIIDYPIDVATMPASILDINYKLAHTETKLLRKIVTSHGLKEAAENENFCLMWTGVHIKPDILRNLTPYQRVNHFPRSYELTRKDRLYKNIQKMQHFRGFKYFDIAPLSYMLPFEYRDLVIAHRSGLRGPWIVKPVASSRGRGIFIVNNPDQISPDDQVLVSKYIVDPLCIDGHKCDIRLYVAVTSFDPLIIYLYEEGLVRLATVKYEKNTENLWNPCMHLCNYSINKYHSDYIKATDTCEDVGHKWAFSALLRHLKNQGCDIGELMMNIEDVIIKSIFSCCQSVVSACRMFVPNGNNCFELYGFDILIDDTLKPWLLEVNLSPSLGIDTPLDAKVKASLLTDLLTLVGIPAINKIARAEYDSKWSRYKLTSHRKSNSSDNVTLNQKKNNTNNLLSTVPTLNSEEIRMVRNARAQYSRKGGFVRIYPTEDSMQKYGSFLDTVTGIPVSHVSHHGGTSCSMLIPHNYNAVLFSQLYPVHANPECTLNNRMEQYERTLNITPLNFLYSSTLPKCSDEANRLKKQIRKLIENGSELSNLQARKAFSQYLYCVLNRLLEEPRQLHEKLILKFITKSCHHIKTPSFMKIPYTKKICGKDRSAMIAKLLGDYLEIYSRDTEAYVDTFDRYGMVPIKLFSEFLAQAQESDLESILTLHTNLNKTMPFLQNDVSLNNTQVPPIPSGVNGFLRALPSMAISDGGPNDLAKIENYYKSLNYHSILDREVEDIIEDSTKPDKISNKQTNVQVVQKRSSCAHLGTSNKNLNI